MPSTAPRRLSRLRQLLPLALGCLLTAAAQSAPADAIEHELAFRAAVESNDLRRAAAAGEAWLAALSSGSPPDHPDLVAPLTEVAGAQRLAGEHEAAELNLRRALALLPDIPPPQDHRRLDTLTELGRLYQAADEHDVAVVAFDEARRLSRLQLGLLNVRQLELLELSGRSYMKLGRSTRAADAADEARLISERRHDPDAPGLLEALYRHAAWLHQLEDLEGEQRALLRAVELIERNGGRHDPRLIDPLLAAAASIRTERSFREEVLLERGGPRRRTYQQAVRLMARAQAVAQANPDIDAEARSRILLEQGDWYMVRDRRQQALERYSDAIALLRDNGRDELVQAWFDAPAVLMQPEPLSLGVRPLAPPPGLQPRQLPVTQYTTDSVYSEIGFVTAQFEVDERGRARHVRVTESQPPRRMHARVHESLREAVFRPRLVDGEPVSADGQQYTFMYAYRP